MQEGRQNAVDFMADLLGNRTLSRRNCQKNLIHHARPILEEVKHDDRDEENDPYRRGKGHATSKNGRGDRYGDIFDRLIAWSYESSKAKLVKRREVGR